MGLLAGLGAILGGVKASTIGATVLGGGLDLAKSQLGKNMDVRRLKKLGLSNYEIGSEGGIAGGPGDSGQQILGNNAAQLDLQQQKLDFDAAQKDKDRAKDIAIAKLGSQTQLATTQLNNATTRYGVDTGRQNHLDNLKLKTDLTSAQIDKVNADTDKVLQDTQIQAVVHDERWPRLFSGMSAENVVTSALAVLNGVPIQAVLTGEGVVNSEALQKFLRQVLARQSHVGKEFTGSAVIIEEMLQNVQGIIDVPNNGTGTSKDGSQGPAARQ